MSAGYTTSVLAVISLIVSAAPLRAQDASAPHDVANIPANAGAFAPRDVDLQRNQSITFGVPAHAADQRQIDPRQTAWQAMSIR